MSNTDTIAVIVTYNRIALLQECIGAVRQQTQVCRILVVDNASTDGTAGWLDAQTDLDVVHMAANVGGAGGFAEGMKRACMMDCRTIWIMDDDTIPEADALERLLQAAQAVGEYGFLASQVYWTDGTPCVMNAITAAKGQPVPDGMAGEVMPAAAATFVSLLFARETVIRMGLPKADYFIWGDDKEYTLRLSDRMPCYAVTQSRVTHKMASNAGSNIKNDDVSRIDRYYYAYRNDLATARARGIGPVAVYFAAFGLNTCRVVFSACDHKSRRLRAMYRGMAAGIRFAPATEFVNTTVIG